MKREFSRKQSKEKKYQRIARPAIVIALVLVLFCGAVLFYKKPTSNIANRFVGLKTWFSEHTSRMHQQIKTAKQQLVNNPPPEIHFEFYTALPKMQIPVTPNANDKLPTPTVIAKKPSLVAMEDASVNPAEKTSLAKVALVDPAELEQEVAQHLQPKTKLKSHGYAYKKKELAPSSIKRLPHNDL